MIARHADETGSRIATRLLDEFDSEVKNFSVVMPTDFASVREILEQAKISGEDPDGTEVWGQILEATNG